MDISIFLKKVSKYYYNRKPLVQNVHFRLVQNGILLQSTFYHDVLKIVDEFLQQCEKRTNMICK
jgi:hypothetical protein